jgi:SAM-dependent methyltransferase
MQIQVQDGIPTEQDYRNLLTTPEFKDLEMFSNDFLQINRKNLGRYAKKWVNDPLHQWSRQWEYPYVFTQIQPILKDKTTIRILDAGSGVTFFPYYIKSQYVSTDVHCTDYDQNLESIYQHINSINGDHRVKFSCSNLNALPFEDNWFDLVYCISVLEHTDDHLKIVEEFHRILRSGGRLVITFDVSLDGTRDISIEKGNTLLRLLAEQFAFTESISLDLSSHVNVSNLFTTLTAEKINPSLLPWRLPHFTYKLKSLITGKRIHTWPPLLTVFCLNMKKTL